MTTLLPPHQHELAEETSFGRPMLSPCKVCGLSAGVILEQLLGDNIRAVVRKFLAQGPRYMRASVGATTTGDSDQWRGAAEARGELLDQLQKAGVDVEATPYVGPSNPSPRHAQAVRALHHLEKMLDDDGRLMFSSCKADGHISDDLETDPCPTLVALNETDPLPVRPIIDPERLAARIYAAVEAALCNGGAPETGWTLVDESRRAAAAIVNDLPTINLANPDIVRAVGHAIAAPGTYAARVGSVPDHQTAAVLAALRKVLR